MPNTEQEWLQIAHDFNSKWNFPNCLGAIDGKHCNIKAPPNSGSLYFNYKGVHSVILMALVDANYRFTYINIGSKGRDSDGGVFNNCYLYSALENNTLNIPSPQPLPQREIPVPFVIVADDAFPLRPYIMKPFAFRNQNAPQRIFNYRLSRARRMVENVFGIISARFRVLRKTVDLHPNKVNNIVSAVCVLHNLLISRSKAVYAPNGTFDIENNDGTIIPGIWRNEEFELRALEATPNRNISIAAKSVREEFEHYFCGEGEVPWQYRYI